MRALHVSFLLHSYSQVQYWFTAAFLFSDVVQRYSSLESERNKFMDKRFAFYSSIFYRNGYCFLYSFYQVLAGSLSNFMNAISHMPQTQLPLVPLYTHLLAGCTGIVSSCLQSFLSLTPLSQACVWLQILSNISWKNYDDQRDIRLIRLLTLYLDF